MSKVAVSPESPELPRKPGLPRLSVRRLAVWGGAVLAVVVLAAALVLLVPIFKVSGFKVEGNSHTDSQAIEQATLIVPGQNLARIDASAAADRVVELPWVRQASVVRQWPSTVRVEVTEREALMYAKRSDGDHLIDSRGVAFIIDSPPAGCVEVTGTKDDDVALFRDVATVLEALSPPVREQIAQVQAPSEYALSLVTVDGRVVEWGSSENAGDKALATAAVLTQEGQQWNVSNPELVTKR